MVLDLVVIGTAITLGPLHNSAFILLLSAQRGLLKGLVFILTWLVELLVVVASVQLMTGGDPLTQQSAPSTAALAVKLTLGVALVVYGERKRRRKHVRSRGTPKWMARLDRVSAWTAAGLAVLLQPWALVAAGGATVVNADLSSAATFVALMTYFLLATSSLLVMELYATFAPAKAAARLTRLRLAIDEHQDQAIVVLSLLIGLWLVASSTYELVT
ncbi:GAP family protein [Embleya scabrispora]|uniref:GAP family protein n=1 Tax=Embleya scabrispora TaxID=159449 RepID=UPI00037E362D|nr:GAP family protein [Embleya scabrispora]MYS80676.1 GAP family protein [Streptomyces sp. SID5474]